MTQGHLLAVGSNPPTASGHRTRARVELAARLLGFERTRLTNLFGLPSYRTGAISELGRDEQGWQLGRVDIVDGLAGAAAVLLAHGLSEPTGPAREHHRDQVTWLADRLGEADLPVWWVGQAPRHPSRWQRYTFRAHPGVPFEQALAASLTVLPIGLVRARMTRSGHPPPAR